MLSSFGFVLFLFNGIISVVGICHSLCIHNICYWTFKIFFYILNNSAMNVLIHISSCTQKSVPGIQGSLTATHFQND